MVRFLKNLLTLHTLFGAYRYGFWGKSGFLTLLFNSMMMLKGVALGANELPGRPHEGAPCLF
jgi:hypothetical protein